MNLELTFENLKSDNKDILNLNIYHKCYSLCILKVLVLIFANITQVDKIRLNCYKLHCS